jgi:hypothetical protein
VRQLYRALCDELSPVLGEAISVSGGRRQRAQTWIQPIGLIVNEFLTNGAKHGGRDLAVEFR